MQLTPLSTVQHASKIQGSVVTVEDFIQLTAFNLCHDKDKLKRTHCRLPVYCAYDSGLPKSVNNKYAGNSSHLAHQGLADVKAAMGQGM